MALTKEQLINWALSRGWSQDNFGHLQKSANGKNYRLKLSNVAVRYEVRVHHEATEYSKAENEWARLQSGYFKDLSIDDENKLHGMSRWVKLTHGCYSNICNGRIKSWTSFGQSVKYLSFPYFGSSKSLTKKITNVWKKLSSGWLIKVGVLPHLKVDGELLHSYFLFHSSHTKMALK